VSKNFRGEWMPEEVGGKTKPKDKAKKKAKR
jgi:hypothetical protein